MNKFKAFWFARTFSYFGDFIFSITLLWFALEQGGAWGVAGAVSIGLVGRALGSFLLAPWINYVGSRKMIVWSDLLRGVVMLMFWAVALWKSDSALLTMTLAFANAFLAGGFDAAMQSYIPTIASELRKANANLASGRSATQLVGFLTGGLLMELFFGAGFLINAITFLVAGVVSMYIGGGEPTMEARAETRSGGELWKRFATNWQQAKKAISDSPTLRLVFWTSLTINTFLVPMLTMMAPLVRDVIGGGSFLLSVVQSAMVVGGLIGAIVMRNLKGKDGNVMVIGALMLGGVGLIASLSHASLMLILTMFVFGLSQAFYNISEATIIQKSEAHLRASIYAIIQVVTVVCYPIATFGAAQLQAITSLRIPFAVGGVIVVLGTLLFTWKWMQATAADAPQGQSEAPQSVSGSR